MAVCLSVCACSTNQYGAYTWVAVRDLKAGEEITWDYETTEYEIMSSALGRCLCGSDACRGKVLGFKHRGAEIRAKYGELIADYLKELPVTGAPALALDVVPAPIPSADVLRAIGLGDTVEIKELSDFGALNRGLFSRRAIRKGEVVMSGRRMSVAPSRTVYSVQVSLDPEMHIELDDITKLANHSCDPNSSPT